MAPLNPYVSSAGSECSHYRRGKGGLAGVGARAVAECRFSRARAGFWGQHLCSPGVGGRVRYWNFLNLRLLIYEKRTIQLVSEDD